MSDRNSYDLPAGQIDDSVKEGALYENPAQKLDPSLDTELDPELNIAQTCPGGFFYTIAAGDNLFIIAARFRTTVEAILRANPGLTPGRLFIGQRICIPVPQPQPGVCPGGFFYTIAAGDNLFIIAARFRTSVEAILRANPGLDPNRLFIGQRICIPVPRP